MKKIIAISALLTSLLAIAGPKADIQTANKLLAEKKVDQAIKVLKDSKNAKGEEAEYESSIRRASSFVLGFPKIVPETSITVSAPITIQFSFLCFCATLFIFAKARFWVIPIEQSACISFSLQVGSSTINGILTWESNAFLFCDEEAKIRLYIEKKILTNQKLD